MSYFSTGAAPFASTGRLVSPEDTSTPPLAIGTSSLLPTSYLPSTPSIAPSARTSFHCITSASALIPNLSNNTAPPAEFSLIRLALSPLSLIKLTELSHFSPSLSYHNSQHDSPNTPTKPTAGRSSAPSPKKRLQATPSLSSLSARSSGSRYPKCAHLKKSSPSPTPVPTQATPSSLHPRHDAPLSASSSSSSQSSFTSMSVSSSDSSVASSTRSAKKPAPRPASKKPALKSPPLQPPALKQLVLTPSALPQPAPSVPLPAPTPALKPSLLQQSPSLTPSPGLDRQALRKQALAAAIQAPLLPSFDSPPQTRVWNASPSPTHFFSKKDGCDKKSIHDVCRLSVAPVYASVNPDDSDWRSATVESLVSLASACFQGSAEWTKSPPSQALRKCLIGLAKMSPQCFDDLYCEGNLMPSTEGQVWLSANRVLGSHWFFKTKPPAPAPSAASASSTQVSGSRSVSFFPSVGAASVISSPVGHFLQRLGVCSSDSRAPVDVTEGTKCSYSSYFTLSLPRLMSPPPSDLYDEMLESLTDALSLLWSVDRKLVLYVFPSRASINPKAKPVHKLWSTLPALCTLELYVVSLWLRVRAAPHLQFYIGHSVPVATLLSDTLLQRLQDREMDFKYDHIQASTTVTCGFLLGSYMQSFDLNHYNALLQTHPRFQAFPIAVIWKNIRLDNSRTPNPSPVPAAHILCDSTKRSQTFKLLKAQFNCCSASDIASLPDGKFYKFIETATNPSDRCLSPSKLRPFIKPSTVSQVHPGP
eukprot:jgi/Psemu1/31481/gm1.31481_g